MDSRLGNVSDCEYINYEPGTETIHEEDGETLLLHLPGFKKHQLRIQLTPNRTLKVSGERPIGANKWSRLFKEYEVSANCDTSKISAKLEDGILQVKQPNLITPVTDQGKEKPVSKPNQKPHEKASSEPQPHKSDSSTENARTGPSHVAQEQQPKHVERKTSDLKLDNKASEAEKTADKDGNDEGKVTGEPSKIYDGAKIFARSSKEAVVKERRMLMNLFAGVLLAIVIGVYVTNWVKSFKKEAN